MKRFFLILALFFSVFAVHSSIFAAQFPVLGPNIEYGMLGMAAPAGLRGAFVPQFNANFGFSWLEPLGADTYGTWEPNRTRYIRFLAGAELSPFYGTVKAGMGFAPLPYPFSILELRFIYANENLLFSDVEMAMKSSEAPPIQKTWNAGYIFDSFYNKSSYSQIQSFNTQLGGTYFGSHFDISLFLQFTLIDIVSDYDKKSFDYMRGIPLYGRDYVIKVDFDFRNRFNEKFAWDLNVFGILSGRQIKGLKEYDKEPLSHYIISTGPLWILNKSKSYISLNSGFFTRRSSDSGFFDDSIADRILLSVEYKHYWNFTFGKK